MGDRMPNPLLEIDKVSKSYGLFGGRQAIRSVTISVDAGQVVGFVGLNGAGKTTTIRIAAGVLLPDSGEVKVEGKSMAREKREASRHVGWVPEAPAHDPNGRLDELLSYYCSF